MKKIHFILILFVSCLFASCKYDQTGEGTYSGTFYTSLPGFATTNGTATVVISKPNKETFQVVVSSSGNPDLVISNVTGDPFYSLDGAVFDLSHPNGSVTIYENDTYKRWSLDIDYSDSTGSLNFEGVRL